MNKRMKDPKGDLRFVHKSTRVYDFSSLKLTAMACGRQARAERQEIRFNALCYEIRLVYEFSLHHSSFGVRHSILV
jgi:hypothetical protein